MNTLFKTGLIAATAAAALAAGSALAQEPAADQAAAEAAVEARQALFEKMGEQLDAVAPMMRRQAPFDAEVIAAAAAEMAVLTEEIPAAFAVDTSGFGGLDTAARNNIWQSHDAFLDKQAALATALVDLQAAAETGDQGPTMRAVAAVGQSCGSCHDDYRND